MTSLTRCDQCQQTSERAAEPMSSWYRLEDMHYGTRGHFCSFPCLAEWSTRVVAAQQKAAERLSAT